MNKSIVYSTVASLLFLSQIASLQSVADEKARGGDKRNAELAQQLQGRWDIVSGVNQGRELLEADLRGSVVTVAANKIVSYDPDEQEKFNAVFTVDESTDPMQINMRTAPPLVSSDPVPADQAPAKALALGIIKVEGDTWVLCYALPGSERPTKFSSEKGERILKFTMRRQKGDPVPEKRSPGTE